VLGTGTKCTQRKEVLLGREMSESKNEGGKERKTKKLEKNIG